MTLPFLLQTITTLPCHLTQYALVNMSASIFVQ